MLHNFKTEPLISNGISKIKKILQRYPITELECKKEKREFPLPNQQMCVHMRLTEQLMQAWWENGVLLLECAKWISLRAPKITEIDTILMIIWLFPIEDGHMYIESDRMTSSAHQTSWAGGRASTTMVVLTRPPACAVWSADSIGADDVILSHSIGICPSSMLFPQSFFHEKITWAVGKRMEELSALSNRSTTLLPW